MDLTNGVGDKSAEVRVANSDPTKTFERFNELPAKSWVQFPNPVLSPNALKFHKQPHNLNFPTPNF